MFDLTSTLTRYTDTLTTAVGASLARLAFGFAASPSGATFVIRLGMPQVELGSVATAVIPTTSAAVSVFESSWYNQTEGTVFAEATKNSSGTSGFPRIAQISDSTNNNAITIIWAESISRLYGAINTGGVTQADVGNNSVAQAAPHKTALAVKINDFAISNDGLNAVTDASGSMPLVDRLFIGKDVGASSLGGTIKRLVYWGQRLPNLQAITQ